MKKVIKDLRPKTKLYRFTHSGCCEFLATGDEFKWTAGRYNETMADIVCPLCGKQFYESDVKEVNPKDPGIWPDDCHHNCWECHADCMYRKVKPGGSPNLCL